MFKLSRKNRHICDVKLKQALEYVAGGMSVNKASRLTGIYQNKIKKLYTAYMKNKEIVINECSKQKCLIAKNNSVDEVFTADQEKTVKEWFEHFETLFHGLTDKECRMLAHQAAKMLNLNVPDTWKYNMATTDWLVRFKNRHSQLDLKKPERCSGHTVRSVIWEKANVNQFYDHLEKLIQSNPIFKDGSRIFNLDETYTSIDTNEKKMKRDSKCDFVTTCCIVGANGISVPPVIVVPYETLEDATELETPPGAITLSAPSGKLTTELFPKVMHHFVKLTNTTPTNPSILIMDIDICHLSISAIFLAEKSGVKLLILHPHMSKLLQPLVVAGLLDSFHALFSAGIESWEAENIENSAEEPIVCDFGKVASEAYVNAMSSEDIKNAFKKCGILPFDRDLFTDSDYKAVSLAPRGITDAGCMDCKLRDDRCKKPTTEPAVRQSRTASKEESDNTSGSGCSTQVQKLPITLNCWAEMSPSQKGSELDKLKRRLIRAVARLLKEKKTEEEVWEELKKESGGNCKSLWERMRSLTMKKLKRLLDADDRVENVPAIARMTLTDWLLYDLVIVHEKIDVIDRKEPRTSKVLDNLFSLVQMFSIEGRSGDNLAEAWTAATVYYNSKGHSCSPMLLQRRWYQMKELTRHVLYKFWYNYRGNEKLLITAKLEAPTDLQKAIALRYPEIITQPFPDWEERIEKKLVIMPDEFEIKMRTKSLMKPSDENAPDVVLVEKKIDTITLADTDSEFSDEEESARVLQDTSINTNEDETSKIPIIVQVKSEPQENIDIEEHYLYQPDEPVDRFQAEIERLEIEEEKIFTDNIDTIENGAIQNEGRQMTLPLITNIKGAAVTEKELALKGDVVMDDYEIGKIKHESHKAVEVDEEETTEKDVAICEKELECMEAYCDEQSQESILIDDEDDDDEVIPLKKESEGIDKIIISEEINTKEEIDMTVDREVENGIQKPAVDMMISDEPVPNEFMPVISTVFSGSEVKTKMEINTEHMDKFEDIEENDVDVIQHIVQNSEECPTIDKDIQKVDTQESHDLDLVEDIVSNMNFADDGIEFADDGIEFVEDHNNQNVINESHAVQEVENDSPPKFDLKLLMNPIVYTTKLDKMIAYKNVSLFDTIDEKKLLDRIIIESKPIKHLPCTESINDEVVKVETTEVNEVDDDLFQNHSSDESDCDVIDESKRIRLSSNLLQKPRSRSYNPIQLCKNPDFNTRLKRLTVGFFSFTRNRVLLKACKPMTIDLSKAFESKLVGGTIYLKPDGHVIETVAEENITESSGSVLPSTVPVQSLMDTTDVDKILEEELKKRMLERNKIVKLPNISVVRQINQQLLMAEVAPIMAQTDKPALPGSAHNIHQNVTIEKEKNTSINNDISNLKSNDSLLMPLDKCPINITPHTDTSKTNNLINYKSTNVNETQYVADSSKSKNDKAVDKLKKKPEKGKHLPKWITKINYPETTALSESLLTIDTLYKMLNALDPCKEFASKLNKPKNKGAKQQKNDNKKKSLDKQGEIETTCITENPTTNDQNKALDKESKEITCSNEKPKTGQNTLQNKRRKRCCWARRRIEKIKSSHVGKGRHPCPQDKCTCCCINILRYKEMENMKMSSSDVQNDAKTNEELNLSEAIETVVQQPCNNISKLRQPAVTIVNSVHSQLKHVTIGVQADLDEYDTYHIIDNAHDAHTQDGTTQNTEPEATASKTPECDGSTIELEVNNEPPSPIIRVYAGNHAYTDNHSPHGKTVGRTRSKATDKPPDTKVTTLHQVLPTQEKPPDIEPKVVKNPVRKKSLYKLYSKEPEIEAEIPCSCRPNVVVDRSSSTLLVDGSNDCLRHTKSRFSKETRIYLNRKTMTATERPFYVGKNKILLTNIKPPKPQSPPPDQLKPITLPDGVQVVLLPDGTITYLVNPDVELTSEQLAAMPLVLNTIMEQIKASGVSLPVPLHESNEVVANVKSNDNPNPILINNDNKSLKNNDANDTQSQEKSSVSDEEHYIAPLDSTQYANEDVIKTVSVVDQIHLNTGRVSEAGENISDDKQQTLPEKGTVSSDEVYPVVDDSETEKLPSPESAVNTNVRESTRKEQNHDSENLEKNEAVNSETEKIPCSPEPTVTANVEEKIRTEQNKVSEDLEKNEGVTSIGSADSNDVVENTNSRNLLSDLMEMSGIVEEDVAPVPLEPPLSQPETVMQPSTLESAQLLGSIPVPGLSPLGSTRNTFTAQMDEKIHELNPITSFAELKYACDNNGLFFKLDLNSGSIVPINVCIQKTQASFANSNITHHPTEVIDLTDDNGVSLNKESSINVASTKTSKTSSGNELVKLMPRKTAQVMHVPSKQQTGRVSLLNPTISSAPMLSTLLSHQSDDITELQCNDTSKQSFVGLSIEQKKKELLSKLSNKLKPLRMLQTKSANLNILRKNKLGVAAFKRNINLNKVEAKIDLVDSDSPMEEEYLVESSDDSSDDEPLAKKAKKMRNTDDIAQIQKENSVFDSAQSLTESVSQASESVSQVINNIDFEAAIDACAVPITAHVPPNVEKNTELPLVPVPTQLVFAQSALSQPIILNHSFLQSEAEDEDSQEDCILGV